jgi:NADPH:quinone reductase-like Zn-dependent oxidoreductase
MKAVVHDRFGPPEVLRVGEVERPVPKEDEVLVGVYASTVTRGDAMGVRSVEYRFTRVLPVFAALGGRSSVRSSRAGSRLSARS